MATADDWRRVVPQAPVPPYEVFTKPIQKSEQDERDYRMIRLENGLNAVLVHDAKADKAAASLDVGVGHLSDPDDMPGLAHFCEHLLFMGTEQFPRENEYSEYLAKNNGHSNAYTATTNTNYYFNVSTSALGGALERFSGFFHSPLFAPGCTSRELNAVNSEHNKNHQSDVWRIFQLNKYLSKPGHVWSKFGSGNRDSLTKAARDLKAKGMLDKGKDSLQASPIPSRIPSPTPSATSSASDSEADGGVIGRETRRRLVEWWTKEYCASRMNLCVIGKESLDELSNMVSTNFSPIVNRGRQSPPTFSEHPFGENEKGTLISVGTVMTFHALEISFPLEWQAPQWRAKPSHFLSHFIGHEGPGSLHSYLKNKHWITGLSSGPQNLARGFAMFKITVHLTEEGFKSYRDIVLACFNYISLLRSSPFPSFAQHERVLLSQMRFRFAEKKRPDDYASSISETMGSPTMAPPELILAASSLTWDWDKDGSDELKIREYLDTFRLSEGRVVLMAKQEEHEKISPGIQWSSEPWYGTQYNVKRWESDFIEQANGPNPLSELYLPGPNEFIPTNLDVEKRDVPEPLKRPHLIRETTSSALWHKKDDKFWVPKAKIVIDIRSPVINETARSSVLTRLFVDLVNDSLTEFTYDADLAGSSYHLFAHSNGIFITVTGYSDKASVLLKHVLENIKHLKVPPGRFSAIQDEVKREWRNFFFGQSHTLSDYYSRYLLTEQQWTVEEKLKEFITIKEEELFPHVKKVLNQTNLRILVAGNIYKDEAIRIAEMAEEGLQACSPDAIQENALVPSEGSDSIWSMPIVNPNQANSAITYYVHFGPIADQHLRVTSSILTKILGEPAFNILRTREQLGYIVLCAPWTLSGSSEKGMRVVIQSDKSPSYLEERIEAFFDEMKERFAAMTPEEFEQHKQGLKKKWLEVDKNLNDETSRFLSHINSGQYDFLRNENDSRLLENITKEDVEALFVSKVHQSSKTRRKLSVHMVSQKQKVKKVSSEALARVELELVSKFPDIDAKKWKESLDEVPTHADFVKYWAGVLGDSEQSRATLATILKILEGYPLPGDKQLENKATATYLKDIPAFKAGLTVARPTGPLVEWNDLPKAKY